MDAIRTLPLALYADLVCPWCWIGERRVHAAIARVRESHPDVRFDLTWHPFQLDPSLPADGRPFAAFVAEKFGGPLRAQPMFDRVTDAGAADGLGFRFDRIAQLPNTVRAHGLVVHVQQTGRDPWPLADALFAAHFRDGEDTGNVDTLVRIAAAHGVPADDARDLLTTGRYDVDVMQSQREAARLGIQGVPLLVLDSRLAVSGAQPTAVFEQALLRVLSE